MEPGLFDDLAVFLAVRDAGSISGAARALKIDASTVSRRIARLEERLGSTLLVRSGRCCPAPFDPNNPPLACDMSQTVDGEAIVRDDITDGSWMADYASIVPGCTNSDYTGAVHDWTRFFWNLTTDENLSPTKIADILEEAGADDWCATGNTPAGCSPGSRIQSACGPTREDCQTEYFNQQHNGVFP